MGDSTVLECNHETQNPMTFFAPPQRSGPGEVRRQNRMFRELPLLSELLDAMPGMAVVLNREREIVLANNRVINALGLPDETGILGERPGEALGCIHAFVEDGGCGTSEFCRTCGAANAILTCQNSGQSVQECRITTKQGQDEEALDFMVWATAFRLVGEDYSFFALSDISHEKRRVSLERIFFHDILNTAGGLRGFTQLLREEAEGEVRETAVLIEQISDSLINEIETHKQLLAAENRELQLGLGRVKTCSLLKSVKERFERHPAAEGRRLAMADDCREVEINSDPVLLGRVIGNLVKNALEASRPTERVVLGCDSDETGNIRFWVRNAGAMDRRVQLQIFKRSFSTKGSGRGLGTYSVKLLGERYLKGRVGFTTDPENGTEFFIALPRDLAAASS